MKKTVKVAKSKMARQKIMVLAIIVLGVGVFGTLALLKSSAASNTTASLSCATNSTHITLTYSYTNAPNGALIHKDGVTIYTFAATSDSGVVDGKAPGTPSTSTRYDIQAGGVLWGSQTCTTKAAPSANLSLASATTSSLTINISYYNYDTTTSLYRGSTLLKTFPTGTNTTQYLDQNLAPNTSYSYSMKWSGGTMVTTTFKTLPTPTGSLACSSATQTSLNVSVGYNNQEGPTNLYRGGTIVASYPTGSANTVHTDSGLTAGTSYTYSLMSGNTSIAPSVNCTTSKPPVAPPVSPPSTTPGGSTAPPATTTTKPRTPTTTKPVAVNNNGVDVVSGGDSSSGLVDGVTVDGSSDTTDSTDGSTTTSDVSTANKNLKAKSSSSLKAVLSALGVVGLMVAGFFGWLIIRSRRLDSEQTYDYSTDYNYSAPPAPPLPDAPAAQDNFEVPALPALAPVANTKLEEIVNSTFYPGQPSMPAQTEEPKANEPLDMFDIANQYPTSFGNSHNILTQQPTVVAKPIEPAPTPPVDPADLIPLPPTPNEPTEPTSGDLTIQH